MLAVVGQPAEVMKKVAVSCALGGGSSLGGVAACCLSAAAWCRSAVGGWLPGGGRVPHGGEGRVCKAAMRCGHGRTETVAAGRYGRGRAVR